MKKYFTLIVALFCTATLFAQVDDTFRFVDGEGKVYPDGSVVNLTELEESDFGGYMINSGLYLENTSKQSKPVRCTLNILSISENTSIQFCVLGNCNSYSAVGSYHKQGIEPAGRKDNLQLEWLTDFTEDETTGEYIALPGSATATLKVTVLNADGSEYGDGPQITLNFSCTDPAGINGVENDKASVVARYSAAGQLLSAPQKGLNIVKLSNGKTIKQIIK